MVRAFRFNRFRGRHILAQDVLVHAESMEEARAKAWKLGSDGATSIEFYSNDPCASPCSICRTAIGGEK